MNTKQKSHERLLSLDFFRGLTMFLLIAEFTQLYRHLHAPELEGSIIYFFGNQLRHHPWHGFHAWDLIQPFFMFIVGVAMPLSYANRIKKGESHSTIFKHIALRSFLLLVMGWFLSCISAGKIVFLFQNVLCQLSVTILIAFLIIRKRPVSQLLISFGILAITEFLYRSFWIDGFNQPFTPDHNFGAWIDMLISGELSRGHWVSFNAIPTAVHTIWGVLAGKLLMSNKTHKYKLKLLIAVGLASLVIGYGLNPITPIIKRISTTSFVFTSAGWTLLALAFSFWLIDMVKVRRGVQFFAIVGMNPLFIYLFAHIGGAILVRQLFFPIAYSSFNWAGELTVNIVASSMALFGLWYICYWLFKRKIFIKI